MEHVSCQSSHSHCAMQARKTCVCPRTPTPSTSLSARLFVCGHVSAIDLTQNTFSILIWQVSVEGVLKQLTIHTTVCLSRTTCPHFQHLPYINDIIAFTSNFFGTDNFDLFVTLDDAVFFPLFLPNDCDDDQ